MARQVTRKVKSGAARNTAKKPGKKASDAAQADSAETGKTGKDAEAARAPGAAPGKRKPRAPSGPAAGSASASRATAARSGKPATDRTADTAKDTAADTGAAGTGAHSPSAPRPASAPARDPAPATAPAAGAAKNAADRKTADMPAPTPNPTPASTPAPGGSDGQHARETRKGSFFAMVLGGLLAGAIGFGAAWYLGNDHWPFSGRPSRTDRLAAALAEQGRALDALRADVESLRGDLAGADLSPRLEAVEKRQEETGSALGDLRAAVDALEARVGELEARPIPDGGANADAAAAYQRELQAMRKMFQGELDRIEQAAREAGSARASAEQSAARAAVRAAVTAMRAAADTGAPFGEELQAIAATGLDVPADLRDQAASGIVTLATLREKFPEFARAAIVAATRAQVESGQTSRLSAFLKTQLGARSLEPKEGNDPDAILSRAEAALKNGDLQGALGEIESLPQAGRKEMAGWVELATARQRALEAIDKLVAQLSE